jgi:general secretion pathway protein N
MNIRTARLATNVLVGICAALMLVAILQYAGFGRGYAWSDDDGSAESAAAPGDIDKQALQMPPASAFAAVDEHPMFNDDRQPTPVDAAGSAGTPPPSPLNVALTGIILDEENHVRVAMLQDKARNQAVALRVGMPLEGEQASWTLVEVKPRLVVFRNAANETAEVELETALKPSAGGAPGGAARGEKASAQGATPRPGAEAPKKSADASSDLAHRIEERRKQMREDAERLRNGAKKPAK